MAPTSGSSLVMVFYLTSSQLQYGGLFDFSLIFHLIAFPMLRSLCRCAQQEAFRCSIVFKGETIRNWVNFSLTPATIVVTTQLLKSLKYVRLFYPPASFVVVYVVSKIILLLVRYIPNEMI